MKYFGIALGIIVAIALVVVGLSLAPTPANAQEPAVPTAPTALEQKLDKLIQLLEQLLAAQVPAPAAVAPVVPADQPDAADTAQYDLPPQPYIPHPSLYQETGVGPAKTQMWNIEVKSGTVAVVGGYNVDGVGGGVYKAVAGPANITTTVTDGFVSVVTQQWGQQEFCFRVNQAVTYGWAHNTVMPLSGWMTCDTPAESQPAVPAAQPVVVPAPAAVVDPDTVTGRARIPTGDGKSLRFVAGDAISGWSFVLDNGGKCEGDCYLSNAPTSGTLTSGVINPWKTEVAGKSEWQ